MPNQKKSIKFILISVIAILSLIAGLFFSMNLNTSKKTVAEQFNGTLLDKPREVSTFELTGIDNKPFNNESLKGQWTMVFFGFTSCGTICPATMAKLNKMYLRLEEDKVSPLPKVVMISIDPKRDNLERLNHYVNGFNPHFFGARGDNEAIVKMTKEMGIAFELSLPADKDSENYDIQHSGALILLNPEGKIRAFFTTPFEPELLAKDYHLLVS